MNSKQLINKTVILGVFAIAGFLLARSIYYQSIIGIICALVAIAAWGIFLYKLNEYQQSEKTLGELLDDQ